MAYTDSQLAQLISDVEREFNAHLAKAEEGEATLAKGEGSEKKPEPKKEEKPEAKPEGEAKPAEAKPEGEAKPAEGAPAAEAAAPTPEAKPEAGAAAPAGHDYDEEDLSHLAKMYESMSKDELMVHHDMVKAALDKCMGMGKSEVSEENKLSPKPSVKGDNLDSDAKNGAIEGQEPHNSPGAKSPASDANGAKINKSEPQRRNGGKIEAQAPANSPGAKSPASDANGAKMNKSEQEVEVELLKSELGSVKTQYDDLKKNFDAVAAFLTKLVEKKAAPAAKAITSLEVVAKGENQSEEKPLTKSEIGNALLKKSQDPSTSKADRDAINNFYLNGGSIESITHLLK